MKIEFVWEASMSDQLTHPHSVKLMTWSLEAFLRMWPAWRVKNVSQYALRASPAAG